MRESANLFPAPEVTPPTVLSLLAMLTAYLSTLAAYSAAFLGV
jgi:hypothetical protein